MEVLPGSNTVAFYIDNPSTPSFKQIDEAYNQFLAKRAESMAAERLIAIRAKRDVLLSASDWTQLSDSPLSDDLKTKWREYRQALRDRPASTEPFWPTPPPTK